MNRTKNPGKLTGLLSIIFFGLLLPGCTAIPNAWGDEETGLILSYRFNNDQPMLYKLITSSTQQLEVMGNKMETGSSATYDYSLKSSGSENDLLKLSFTIDSMTMVFKSPMGEQNLDLEQVLGKMFEMRISSIGEELEFMGLEEVKYDIGNGRKRGIASDFKKIFPNLPDHAIKLNESWITYDSLTVSEDDSNIDLSFESNNTLVGFEKHMNFECVKIVSDVTGQLKGTGNERGMEYNFEGIITGNDTWFYAYKEGYLIEMKSGATTKADINAGGIMIPMTMLISNENFLIK